MIRPAVPADAEALLSIYGQYIDTPVTFEYALPSAEGFRARIEDITRTYPFLVYEQDGVILGYAYAHRYAAREAYQWGAELSVYIDRDACSRGIGKALYGCLIELLRLQNIKTVYGIVTHPNEKSDRLHASMGFAVAGTAHSAGYKNGRWHDVTTYERSIAPYDDPPAPLRPIRDAPAMAVERIISAYRKEGEKK